jgi:serine/threonine protein kinase
VPGGGTSAIALLVQRDDEILVLKYARESKDNDRLRKEHEILTSLRSELIVSAKELLAFPYGNAGFLMEYAGEWDRKKPGPEDQRTEAVRDTLAREIKAFGRLSLEFLVRYGEDLLNVVRYLEEKGVAHRDLKPENIGIKEYAKKLHLKVFDFSLSSAPLDNVRVGTPPYLEPFLQLRHRWDTAAERYAAAVILYEMATGATPRWGDGQSAPHLTDAQIVIDAELFDAPVREDLADFFGHCFERDPKDRYDNAAEMLAGWHNVFHRATAAESRPSDPDARRAALDNLRPDALITQLGLTTRAQNTLDRLGIVTAQELAAQPPGKFSNLRGVGNKTKREIKELIGELRLRMPQSPIPERSAAKPLPAFDSEDTQQTVEITVDGLTALLIPVESSPSGKVSRKLLAQFLELDDTSSGPPQYPTQTQIAEAAGKRRAQIGQIIVSARDRWRRSVPPLTAIRNELAEFLKAEGGVVQIGELARFLIASHGSDAPEPLARRRAAAVVRAALEAEKPSATNRFEERRRGNLFLIARSEEPHGAQALDYAEKIAEAGTRLAATDPLPSPARVVESLRAVPCPGPQLRDDALVRLAASSGEVAVSPRLELYPNHLEPLRALKLARAGLAGIAKITTEELRSRVRDRYPDAQPLPDRPELTDLLIKAGLAFTWDEAQSVWLAPPPPQFASSTSLQTSWIVPVERSPEIDLAFDFERRLQAAYRVPSYLVIATEPRVKYLNQVGENISRHFPMAVFDCEREILAGLRREAEAKKIKWEVIARADAAGPGTRDWENLLKIAATAARRVEEELKARQSSTLVIYPGLLGRYGQLSVLERLADSLGPHSLWLLTGSDRQSASPMADGHAIPARSTQWAWVPKKWLDIKFPTVTV